MLPAACKPSQSFDQLCLEPHKPHSHSPAAAATMPTVDAIIGGHRHDTTTINEINKMHPCPRGTVVKCALSCLFMPPTQMIDYFCQRFHVYFKMGPVVRYNDL